MIKRMIVLVLAGAFALLAFAACALSQDAASSSAAQVATSSAAITNVNVQAEAAETTEAIGSVAVVEASSAAVSAADVLAEKSAANDDVEDAAWDSAAEVPIVLSGDSITADAAGVTVEGSQATITAAGTYTISGALSDGQIVVDTQNEGVVRLILNGVNIRNSTGAAIAVSDAEEVVIVLADGSENLVADGASYVFALPAEDEPNAAIFSKADLTITGNGALTVEGNYNDGIASKDGLVIASGNITVSALDDGMRGKDYLLVEDGKVAVTAQGDGLKSDNEEDAAKGYVAIQAGVIEVTAGGDAITAQTDVLISDGQFTLVSGGGSSAWIDEAASAKGIKGAASVTIDGGTFTIDAADDAIHSNGAVTVNGGAFGLATGDDGVHADSTLTIDGGDIRITQSYEGLESAVITINAGDIDLVASDDGINIAGGNDASGMGRGVGPGGRMRPGQDAVTYTGNQYLTINGGTIVVEAAGDGLDVNGAVKMTGGLVVVNGPIENMNSALDYDAGFTISGGFLIAAGSAGMAQAPDASSSQYSIQITYPSPLQAGAAVHIESSDGDEVVTFAPLKIYQSIVFSSPELAEGVTYDLYYEGSAAGEEQGGLYLDGTYTPGESIATFTISDTVTRIGNSYR